MADYIIHGKKGNGKSLVVVGRIRDALLAGKVVATNLNLVLENLLPHGTRTVRCFRLPDRPTIDDLIALGRGSDSVDESTYGLIALDECASMLNARAFNDKGRSAMLDWFVHSRKLGWDSYFICQNPVQIDKQVRESLVELSVSCKRMDRVRIPFLGSFTKNILGFEIRPPKLHVATVRYGSGNDAVISDRWVYTGTHLYAGYDTRQVFSESYSHGLFSLLSPWHVVGRLSEPHLRPSQRLARWVRSFFAPSSTRQERPKALLVELLARLPADERIGHWRRLSALGAI
ncbi:MAG: zonular occludens toxin domain-containing protein [Massilia sp.]